MKKLRWLLILLFTSAHVVAWASCPPWVVTDGEGHDLMRFFNDGGQIKFERYENIDRAIRCKIDDNFICLSSYIVDIAWPKNKNSSSWEYNGKHFEVISEFEHTSGNIKKNVYFVEVSGASKSMFSYTSDDDLLYFKNDKGAIYISITSFRDFYNCGHIL